MSIIFYLSFRFVFLFRIYHMVFYFVSLFLLLVLFLCWAQGPSIRPITRFKPIFTGPIQSILQPNSKSKLDPQTQPIFRLRVQLSEAHFRSKSEPFAKAQSAWPFFLKMACTVVTLISRMIGQASLSPCARLLYPFCDRPARNFPRPTVTFPFAQSQNNPCSSQPPHVRSFSINLHA